MTKKHNESKTFEQCRRNILYNFSLLLTDLNEKMKALFELGVDEEKLILLEGTDIEQQSHCYKVLDKEFIDILLSILNEEDGKKTAGEIKEEDGKKTAREIKDLFYTYSEDYSKLLTSYSDLMINLTKLLDKIL